MLSALRIVLLAVTDYNFAFFLRDDSTVLLLTFDAIILPDEYKIFYLLMVFWVDLDFLGSLTDAFNVAHFSVGRYWLQLFAFFLRDAYTVLLLKFDAILLPDE